MKIMIMGRYERRDELAVYAQELTDMGHTVTSRWLDPATSVSAQMAEGVEKYDEKGFSDAYAALAEPMAEIDMQDTLDGQIQILFSEHPTVPVVRGARHVEFGMAMGFDIAIHAVSQVTGIPMEALASVGLLPKRMIVVGPRENVYHCLREAVEVYSDWESAKAAIGNAESAFADAPKVHNPIYGLDGRDILK